MTVKHIYVTQTNYSVSKDKHYLSTTSIYEYYTTKSMVSYLNNLYSVKSQCCFKTIATSVSQVYESEPWGSHFRTEAKVAPFSLHFKPLQNIFEIDEYIIWFLHYTDQKLIQLKVCITFRILNLRLLYRISVSINISQTIYEQIDSQTMTQKEKKQHTRRIRNNDYDQLNIHLLSIFLRYKSKLNKVDQKSNFGLKSLVQFKEVT